MLNLLGRIFKNDATKSKPLKNGSDLFAQILKGETTEIKLSKDEIADMLKTSPEALRIFEESYRENVLNRYIPEDDFLETNSRQASKRMKHIDPEDKGMNDVISRIVTSLLLQTAVYRYDGNEESITRFDADAEFKPVDIEEINGMPEDVRPQFTADACTKDVAGNSSDVLLFMYKKWKTEKDESKKQEYYHIFRQGLDILDIDPLVYSMIETNPASMGYWIHPLVKAVQKQDFFKIPATSIISVPITMLQMTRQDYYTRNPATLKVVDDFCMKAFELDENKDYFIKTGTYSSKFDFRNAYVHGNKEVRELGEYLLYIHFQALMHASPLCNPVIYGMSTTTEWVVREFIHDKENNPCIYKGLPLHTEYRLFADFDTDQLLGISPYWRPDIMKKRFGHMKDADSPHQKHDYVIYLAHEQKLMERYDKNKDMICKKMQKVICDISLPGQWSIDIMQNGNDFYIIDMAPAHTSALNDCIPSTLLKIPEENWLPKIP